MKNDYLLCESLIKSEIGIGWVYSLNHIFYATIEFETASPFAKRKVILVNVIACLLSAYTLIFSRPFEFRDNILVFVRMTSEKVKMVLNNKNITYFQDKHLKYQNR